MGKRDKGEKSRRKEKRVDPTTRGPKERGGSRVDIQNAHDQEMLDPPSQPHHQQQQQSDPVQTAPPPLDLSNEEEVHQAFEELYLQRMTTEFADDLDTLRQADDFTDASVPMLIAALKQGTDIFSVEEKRAVVEAARRGV